MSPEERMTIDEQRKYLHKMRIRYWQATSRTQRSKLLDEMEFVNNTSCLTSRPKTSSRCGMS